MSKVVLSLISHTNIGKTTLTRTLLERDVGEVRDEAHVTAESASYSLLKSGDDELILWDTPGFGNVRDILKRLRQEGGMTGWLMHEVVDRLVNKARYSSVEAAKNVRREADVVLYLVNVREKPEDAHYVAMELELVHALGKPLLLVLNQIDDKQLADEKALPTLVRAWRDRFGAEHGVRDILVLDAFTRAWQQELLLIDRLSHVLPAEQRETLMRLRAHFLDHQRQRVLACAKAAGDVLWFALQQRIQPEKDADPKKVLEGMAATLQRRIDAYVDILVVQHNIEAKGRMKLEADMAAVSGLVSKPMEEKRTGFIAGLASSVSSGLMADILSGGLTFGGGAILGFLGGFLGGVSYARLFNFFRRAGVVTWQEEPLRQIFKMLLAYYLLTAMHGRGKGRLQVQEPAPFILNAIEKNWEMIETKLTSLLEHDPDADPDVPDSVFRGAMIDLFESAANQAVKAIYPGEDENVPVN